MHISTHEIFVKGRIKKLIYLQTYSQNGRGQRLVAKRETREKRTKLILSSNARINYACRPIMTGFRNFAGSNVDRSFANCQLFSLIYAFNWQGEKMDASKSFT